MQDGTRISQYELLGRLGHGASAEVWRARHLALGSLHAVKILSVSTPQMARRLVREGRVQASLRHPNIVPVTDLIQQGETIALVMELIQGGSLLDRLRDRGRLPPPEVRAILGAVLDGLDLAHRAGVLHRDLKLANVLMDGEIPRIADFGLARTSGAARELDMTLAGQPMGTPGYMPPEQWADPSTIDARADLFALGVIAYELLSGGSPFSGVTPTEVLNATVAGRFTDLRALVPGCPEDLAAAVDRALSPERRDRFPSCPAMAAALSLSLTARAAPILTAPEPLDREPAGAETLVASTEIAIDAGPGVLDGGLVGRIAPEADHPIEPPRRRRRSGSRRALILIGLALSLAIGARWIRSADGPLPAGALEPPAVDPAAGEQPCAGGADERLGYWFPGLRFRGRAGDVITVGVTSHVRADYPTAENDWEDDAPIRCILQPGQRIHLREDPLPSRRRRSWLALYGGDLL